MNAKLIVQGINSVHTVFVQIVLRQANGRHGLFIENHTNSRRRFMSYGLLRTFAQRGLVPVCEAVEYLPACASLLHAQVFGVTNPCVRKLNIRKPLELVSKLQRSPRFTLYHIVDFPISLCDFPDFPCITFVISSISLK